MRFERCRAPAAVALAALLPGCYGMQLLREPVTVDETAADVQALRQQQVETSQRLRELEDQVAKQMELIRQGKADDQSRWSDLEASLLAIDSKLQDALARPSAPVTPSSRYGGSYWSGQSEAAGPPSEPSGGAPDTSAARSMVGGAVLANDDAEVKRIYDQAYLDENKGNYALAILGFREYLRRAPSTELADNAQYWVGEAFYAQRDFEQAISEFLKVLSQYPRGDKVPSALLKTGYSFLQLDDKASARRYLNQVVEEYPSSDESKLARSKLASIQ